MEPRELSNEISPRFDAELKPHLKSFLLENERTNSVSLIDILKFSGMDHNNADGSSAPMNNRPYFRRTTLSNHKLQLHEFEKTLMHQKLHGGHIVKILLDLKLAKEEEVAAELTTHHAFPYLPLKYYEINPDAVKMIPKELATEHLLMPLDLFNDNLMIAMVNPLDLQAIRKVGNISKCSVQVFVSTLSDITTAIAKHYKQKHTFSPEN